MNRKITAFQLCLAAMAACINVAGGTACPDSSSAGLSG